MSIEMQKINQTSRTILFEEFDSGSITNLYTLLKNEYNGNTEKFLDELRKLEVSSFEEFIEKFAPKVYEVVRPSQGGFEVIYQLEKPQGQCREINITDQNFFKMVLRLYKEKGASGLNNKAFDYDEIREMLSPKQEQKKVREIRKDLEYNYNKFLQLEGNVEKTLDRQVAAKSLQKLRKTIVENYNQSPIALIPLVLADTEDKLKLIQPSNNDVVEDTVSSATISGYLQYANNGNLELVESSQEGQEIISSSNTSTQLANYISNDFNKHANSNIKSSEFISQLIVSSYVANDSQNSLSIVELENRRDVYQAIYKDSQENFVNTVSIVVQKLIGVYSFFEHASIDGKLERPLLVTNCRVEELLREETKDKLKSLLSTLNNTPKEKIWFAILPALCTEEYKPVVVTKEEFDFDMDDLDFDMDDNEESLRTNTSMTSGKRLFKEILDKLNIMTFFNFYACEETGFMNLTASVIDEYKNSLSDITSENAVFSYPNFTILPLEKTYIELGTDHMKIPGVFLDSSYVACGMVLSYQNPKLIKSKGYDVKSDYPGVRFDIEKEDTKKVFITNLNRESRLNWSKEIEDAINEDSFGFSFTSNEIYSNLVLVPNTSIYTARTMKKNKVDNRFSPIYKTLTKEFVNTYIKDMKTVTEIKKFINKSVDEWSSEAEYSNSVMNNILRKDDKIEFIEASKKLNITFKNIEEVIDIEIIND